MNKYLLKLVKINNYFIQLHFPIFNQQIIWRQQKKSSLNSLLPTYLRNSIFSTPAINPKVISQHKNQLKFIHQKCIILHFSTCYLRHLSQYFLMSIDHKIEYKISSEFTQNHQSSLALQVIIPSTST